MSNKFDLSIDINNEEFKKIREILLKNSSNALRHFVLEIPDEKLDVVEYSEYQKLEQENQQLKKQLEELMKTNNVLTQELTKDSDIKQEYLTTCCGIPIGDIPKLTNQQKEFVKYLEEEIKRLKDLQKYAIEVFNNKTVINFDLAKKSIEEYGLLIAQSEVILAKYNEIIGGENENKTFI